MLDRMKLYVITHFTVLAIKLRNNNFYSQLTFYHETKVLYSVKPALYEITGVKNRKIINTFFNCLILFTKRRCAIYFFLLALRITFVTSCMPQDK